LRTRNKKEKGDKTRRERIEKTVELCCPNSYKVETPDVSAP